MDETERTMRSFPCAYCRAEPGEPCVTSSGNRSSVSHASRFRQAGAAGWPPVAEVAAGGLDPAKRAIAALPPGVQLPTVQLLNAELDRRQMDAGVELAANTVSRILELTPDLTIEDGRELLAWQEAGQPPDEPVTADQ